MDPQGVGLADAAVLLLSGSDYDGDVQAACLLGANGYLVKPATYEETVEMAKAIKAFRFGANQGPRLG